jgi:hypothetical protein
MIVRNFYKFSSSNKRIPYISLIFFFRTNPNISGLAHIAVEIVFTGMASLQGLLWPWGTRRDKPQTQEDKPREEKHI